MDSEWRGKLLNAISWETAGLLGDIASEGPQKWRESERPDEASRRRLHVRGSEETRCLRYAVSIATLLIMVNRTSRLKTRDGSTMPDKFMQYMFPCRYMIVYHFIIMIWALRLIYVLFNAPNKVAKPLSFSRARSTSSQWAAQENLVTA